MLAEGAAAYYSLIETVKLNGCHPEVFLRDLLSRVAVPGQTIRCSPRQWSVLGRIAVFSLGDWLVSRGVMRLLFARFSKVLPLLMSCLIFRA
jgi:hypothetical protein